MTKTQAAEVLKGLAEKYHRLEDQTGSALAGVHGEIAQALEVALSTLEGHM